MTTAEKSLPKSESSSRNNRSRNCFLHDADAHTDPKLQRILVKHGAEGYGVIWFLLEMMRRETDLHITRFNSDIYAHQLRLTTDSVNAVIDTAIQLGFFSEDENEQGLIYSDNLIRDVHSFEIKKERARKRMKALRERDANKSEQSRTQAEDEDQEEDEAEEPSRRTRKKAGGQPKTNYGVHGYVWLTQSEVQRYTLKHGEDFLNRAIEKLDSWIASDPIPKRIRNGKNASACFGSWVFNAIAEEQQKSLSTSHSGKSPPGKNSVSESYKRIFEEIAK